jgi:hypothetical protein
MTAAAERPEMSATAGDPTLAWLVRHRRTAALQLEALSTRAARHNLGRTVALRRRLRALDAAIARRTAAR